MTNGKDAMHGTRPSPAQLRSLATAITEPAGERPDVIPPSRAQGRRYAEAAQEWDQLEGEVRSLSAELTAANSRVLLLDEANKMLHEDKDHAEAAHRRERAEMVAEHREELDRLRHELSLVLEDNTRIKTGLHNASGILLELHKSTLPPKKSPVSDYAPRSQRDPSDLTEEEGRRFAQMERVPAVITAGPAAEEPDDALQQL